MSYTPTNWKAGDVVTSAKLNKMEQGIAASGGIRIVHLTVNENNLMQLDITPNELMSAFDNEEIVIIIGYGEEDIGTFQSLISHFYYDGTMYEVGFNFGTRLRLLSSSNSDEYFTQEESSGDDSGTA